MSLEQRRGVGTPGSPVPAAAPPATGPSTRPTAGTAPSSTDGPPDPVDVLRAAMTEAHTAATEQHATEHGAEHAGEHEPATEPASPEPVSPPATPPAGPEPIAVAAAALSDRSADQPPPPWLPDYVEYRSGRLPRLVLGCLFVPTVVAAVVALFWAAGVGSTLGLVSAAALAGAAVMLFRALLEWAPTVVSLSGGRLEVSRGDRVVQVDLCSPSTRVVLGEDPRSLGWRTIVSRPGERDLVIRRRHVRARQFAQIVGHHRRTLGA